MGYRFFGASLDALDAPEKVNLKRAYLRFAAAGFEREDRFKDPYDVLAFDLFDVFWRRGDVIPAGKLKVETWLTPKPSPCDMERMEPAAFAGFLDSGGCRTYADAVRRFVAGEVFPDLPIMAGVDHSLTGGALAALSGRYGADGLTAIVLDSHFDAVPLDVRLAAASVVMGAPTPAVPPSGGGAGARPDAARRGAYTCGNFLEFLLDEGTLKHSNLVVAGVSDYPHPRTTDTGGEELKAFAECYLGFERRGVRFLTRAQIEDDAVFPLCFERILDGVRTKGAYVSLDADAGAHRGIYAARFADVIGVGEERLYEIAERIRARVERGQFELAGFDLMEMDVHLMGLRTPGGIEDRTGEICAGFARRLLGI
ncbi:MAG: arginase family protein [bacterium]